MTLTELLISITIGVVLLGLVALALPVNMGYGLRGQNTQLLSNVKMLHLATQSMTLDGITTGDTNLPTWTCWGTNPLTYNEWTNELVKNGYVSQTDLQKLLSASIARDSWFGRKITPLTNVFTVFAVTEEDPGNTLLLATRNWQGLTAPGLAPGAYPTNGFVVFRKGGDGAILLSRETTNAKVIGSGGMHNYLPLK